MDAQLQLLVANSAELLPKIFVFFLIFCNHNNRCSNPIYKLPTLQHCCPKYLSFILQPQLWMPTSNYWLPTLQNCCSKYLCSFFLYNHNYMCPNPIYKLPPLQHCCTKYLSSSFFSANTITDAHLRLKYFATTFTNAQIKKNDIRDVGRTTDLVLVFLVPTGSHWLSSSVMT